MSAVPDRAGEPTVTSPSSQVDALLRRARDHAAATPGEDLPGAPELAVAVLTCMDCRIDPAALLGLENGQVHVLRNAGGVVSDDAIRSLAISQHKLGTREVMLIHHTQCGMLTLTDDGFRAELQALTGLAPSFAIESFTDLEADVRQSMLRVANSPFLLHRDAVRGFIYDLRDRTLTEVSAD